MARLVFNPIGYNTIAPPSHLKTQVHTTEPQPEARAEEPLQDGNQAREPPPEGEDGQDPPGGQEVSHVQEHQSRGHAGQDPRRGSPCA